MTKTHSSLTQVYEPCDTSVFFYTVISKIKGGSERPSGIYLSGFSKISQVLLEQLQ